jgi:hypothetical protein
MVQNGPAPAHLLGHNQRHGQGCLTSSVESIDVLVSLRIIDFEFPSRKEKI